MIIDTAKKILIFVVRDAQEEEEGAITFKNDELDEKQELDSSKNLHESV